MNKEFYFPIVHLFAILSLMKYFVDFLMSFVVTMRVDVNLKIYQCQYIAMSKF